MAKKKIDVIVEEVTYEVSKKGLIVWGEVCGKFDTLIQSIFGEDMDGVTQDNYIFMIPKIVQKNIPSVIDLLELATPIPKNVLHSDDFGIEEAIDALIAVIEVNNLLGVTEKAKKLMALFTKK